jgi:hypothetical protein
MKDHGLEFLLAFHVRIHLLERGYWPKFEIERVEADVARPHGLRYSFTQHGPTGKRLIGFDTAHAVRLPGSRFRKEPAGHDHWHRTGTDVGRPYRFIDAETLLDDFFREVSRVLMERGIPSNVIGEEEI